MGKYIKHDKTNTNIAKVSLCLLEKLNEKFKSKDIDLSSRDCTFSIPIVTPEEYPYCHDAIVAVQRGYKALGWKCLMTHYARRENKETKNVAHGFVFTFSKLKEIKQIGDNLPF